MSMLEHALDYARRGWFVFPIEARGKKPLTLNGMTAATTSSETIKKWWGLWPEANIGLNCVKSGLVVVDIDPRNSGDATWTEYVLKNELIGAPPKTLTARSGGGGTHYVYRTTADAKFKQELKKDGGVDLKHRGYILLEPSIHPSGGKYEWTSDLEDSGPPELLPDWMYADMKREAASASDFTGEPVDNETWKLLQEAIKHTTIKEKRAEWVAQGMALHSTGRGAEALALWHERSELTDSYDYDELEDEWLTFKTKKDGGIRSYKSIFHEAKVGGWVHPGGAHRWTDDEEEAFKDCPPLPDEPPAIVVEIQTDKPVKKKRRLRLVEWADMTTGVKDQQLVQNLIPARSLTTIFGPSGAGKTFFAQRMCMDVALGQDFFGRKTNQVPVAYIAAEAFASATRRLAAARARDGYQSDPNQLYAIWGHVDLKSKEIADELIELLEGRPHPPGLVVIDTLAAAWAGIEENSSDGMGAVVGAMAAIRDRFNCAVVVVHHSGKDATLGARGHTSLKGAVDVEIQVVALNDQTRARVTKARDGKNGDEFFGDLEIFDIGEDQWGQTVYTGILRPAGDQVAAAKAFEETGEPKGANQKLLWQELKALWIVANGSPLDVSEAYAAGKSKFPLGASKQNSAESRTKNAVDTALAGLSAAGWINRNGDKITEVRL